MKKVVLTIALLTWDFGNTHTGFPELSQSAGMQAVQQYCIIAAVVWLLVFLFSTKDW